MVKRRDCSRKARGRDFVHVAVAVAVAVNVNVNVNVNVGLEATFAAGGRYGEMLSFQRLDIYQRATEFLALALRITAALPRGHAVIADQLRRASLSVPLNIAEGAGRTSSADAARHYSIARGSAMECAAIIDALAILRLIDATTVTEANSLLSRIVAMATKLCH